MAAGTPREILRRIKGIKSTQQITRAMEMVAAVKLTKVRLQAENARPYIDNLGLIMRALCACFTINEIEHLFFQPRKAENIKLLVITSDRGLCGTFNLNIINAAKKFIQEKRDSDINVSITAIGKKGTDTLKKTGYTIEQSHPGPWGEEIRHLSSVLSTNFVESFETKETDAVYLLYSRFENVLTHVPTIVQYLPVEPLTADEAQHHLKKSTDFLIEPDIEVFASELTPEYLQAKLYHCMIESLASEYAARMVSMRNASDNADEVIEDLTLSYNKARQSSITKDLIDIISGVEALKG